MFYCHCPHCHVCLAIPRELDESPVQCRACRATIPPTSDERKPTSHANHLWLVIVGVALLLVVVGLTGLGYGIWHSYQNPWQISTSKEGEYVVEFPGRPEVTTRPHTHALGSTTIHLQGTTTDDRTQSYTVGYVDLPEEWLKKSSKNEVLNDALIWVTKGHGNVNEKSRKDIWHGKWPGRELATVVGDDGGGLIARAFLVERRIYVVYVSWLYSKDVPDKASRFMDSFQVLRFSVLQK